MDISEQLEFFRTRFGRVCTKADIDVFRADLVRLNLDVMSAALRQSLEAATAAKRAPRDVRASVLAQYNRIVASQAQLFPVFFVFESAWRSLVAARLDALYQTGDWWHPIRDLVAAGREPSASMRLAGTVTTREVVITIVHILKAPGVRPGSLQTTYELLSAGTLGALERIIERNWSPVAQVLANRSADGRMTLETFKASYRLVREARNEMFHHRRVSDRREVLKAAETLLGALDMDLAARIADIRGAEVPLDLLRSARVRPG